MLALRLNRDAETKLLSLEKDATEVETAFKRSAMAVNAVVTNECIFSLFNHHCQYSLFFSFIGS
jgi:hypothetical protein